MKAGTYYVGDLCYVLTDAEWNEVCDDLRENEEFTLSNGKIIFLGSTAYGDGEYTDNYGRLYSVDSGTLGVVCVDDLDEDELSDEDIVVEFTSDFPCYVENGVFRFGNIVIDTNAEEWDEEDEEEDAWDEED